MLSTDCLDLPAQWGSIKQARKYDSGALTVSISLGMSSARRSLRVCALAEVEAKREAATVRATCAVRACVTCPFSTAQAASGTEGAYLLDGRAEHGRGSGCGVRWRRVRPVTDAGSTQVCPGECGLRVSTDQRVKFVPSPKKKLDLTWRSGQSHAGAYSGLQIVRCPMAKRKRSTQPKAEQSNQDRLLPQVVPSFMTHRPMAHIYPCRKNSIDNGHTPTRSPIML